MNTIKFSHDYKKLPLLWEGTQAVLLSATKYSLSALNTRLRALLERDTKFRGEAGHYELNFEGGLLLIFWHLNTGELFTTIRRYTHTKYDYYLSKLGETFMLVKS